MPKLDVAGSLTMYSAELLQATDTAGKALL
jgi:hypothetical protein